MCTSALGCQAVPVLVSAHHRQLVGALVEGSRFHSVSGFIDRSSGLTAVSPERARRTWR